MPEELDQMSDHRKSETQRGPFNWGRRDVTAASSRSFNKQTRAMVFLLLQRRGMSLR